MRLSEGAILESYPSSGSRRVRIVKNHGNGYLTIRNIETNRRTRVSEGTLRKSYKVVDGLGRDKPATPRPAASRALTPLTTPREKELMRIVKEKFADFNKRRQHFYIGGGMSTTHIVTAVMADIKQIELFWPKELIRRGAFGNHTYVLEGRVFERVQNAVRDTLKTLASKGYLEKVGNTDERRWKPTYRD